MFGRVQSGWGAIYIYYVIYYYIYIVCVYVYIYISTEIDILHRYITDYI